MKRRESLALPLNGNVSVDVLYSGDADSELAETISPRRSNNKIEEELVRQTRRLEEISRSTAALVSQISLNARDLVRPGSNNDKNRDSPEKMLRCAENELKDFLNDQRERTNRKAMRLVKVYVSLDRVEQICQHRSENSLMRCFRLWYELTRERYEIPDSTPVREYTHLLENFKTPHHLSHRKMPQTIRKQKQEIERLNAKLQLYRNVLGSKPRDDDDDDDDGDDGEEEEEGDVEKVQQQAKSKNQQVNTTTCSMCSQARYFVKQNNIMSGPTIKKVIACMPSPQGYMAAALLRAVFMRYVGHDDENMMSQIQFIVFATDCELVNKQNNYHIEMESSRTCIDVSELWRIVFDTYRLSSTTATTTKDAEMPTEWCMDFDDFVRAIMDISSHLYRDLDPVSSLSEFIKVRIVPMSLSIMMERRNYDGKHDVKEGEEQEEEEEEEENVEMMKTIQIKRVLKRGYSNDTFGSNEWTSSFTSSPQHFDQQGPPTRMDSRGTLGSHYSTVRRVSSGTIDAELGLEDEKEDEDRVITKRTSSPRSTVLPASKLLSYIRKIFLRKSDIGTKDTSGARMSVDVMLRFARDCGLIPQKVTRPELLRMLRSRMRRGRRRHEGISYDMFVEILETIASVCYKETYSNRGMELQMLLFYMDLHAQGSLFNSQVPPIKNSKRNSSKVIEEAEEQEEETNFENEFASSISSTCGKLRRSMHRFGLYVVIGNSELRLLLRIFKFYATFGERNRVQENPITMTSTRFMKLIRDAHVPRSHSCGTDKASVDLIFESTLVWQRRCSRLRISNNVSIGRKDNYRRRRLNFGCFCIALIEISRRLYRNHEVDGEEEDRFHHLFITRSNTKNDANLNGESLCSLLEDYLSNATSQWNMLSSSERFLKSSSKLERFEEQKIKERVVDPIITDEEEQEQEQEEDTMKDTIRRPRHHHHHHRHPRDVSKMMKSSIQLKLENDRARLVDILKTTIRDHRLNAMCRCSIRAQRRLVRSAWSRWILLIHRDGDGKKNDTRNNLEKDVDALRESVSELRNRLQKAKAESWKWKRRYIEKTAMST